MEIDFPFSISQFAFFQRDELEAAKLEDYFETNKPVCHYCILCKQRITINPNFANFDENEIELEFFIQNKSDLLHERIKIKHAYTGLKSVQIVSEFPYRQFKLIDENEDALIDISKATYVLERPEFYQQVINKDYLDYEILYIGKSFPSNDNLPALSRIASHSTYQEILEHYNLAHPDKEIFLLLFSFKQDILVDMPEELSREDAKKLAKYFETLYMIPKSKSYNESILLFEVALINYFKPIYNCHFNKNAPAKSHRSFKNTSEMSVKNISILFGLDNFYPRLYTSKNERNGEYYIHFKW